jgi:hypothetical protein
MEQRSARARIYAALVSAILLHLPFSTAWASSHFTPKQLEALGTYVGKTYWVVGGERQSPSFLSAPSPSALSFQPAVKESFDIKEIVGGTLQIPLYYFKVTFDSGKEGYISIGSFLEELNAAFATVDPDREIKRKLAQEAEEESRRQEWIRRQPWPEHVKEAALKRQAVLGMNTKEARAVLGKPKSMVPIRGANPLMGKLEQWIYDGGPVLTFTNGLLTRIQALEAKPE